MDIKAPLREDYKAHGNSGAQPYIRSICLHSTEGSTAQGAASWFQNPASVGSAHIVVDDNEGYRTLPNGLVAWGAAGFNTGVLHCELAGFAAWTRRDWMSHKRMLKRAAYHVAIWCHRYNINPYYIGTEKLKSGKVDGVTCHFNVTEAFGASTHTDPGSGFPRRYFMRLVRRYLRRL